MVYSGSVKHKAQGLDAAHPGCYLTHEQLL